MNIDIIVYSAERDINGMLLQDRVEICLDDLDLVSIIKIHNNVTPKQWALCWSTEDEWNAIDIKNKRLANQLIDTKKYFEVRLIEESDHELQAAYIYAKAIYGSVKYEAISNPLLAMLLARQAL